MNKSVYLARLIILVLFFLFVAFLYHKMIGPAALSLILFSTVFVISFQN